MGRHTDATTKAGLEDGDNLLRATSCCQIIERRVSFASLCIDDTGCVSILSTSSNACLRRHRRSRSQGSRSSRERGATRPKELDSSDAANSSVVAPLPVIDQLARWSRQLDASLGKMLGMVSLDDHSDRECVSEGSPSCSNKDGRRGAPPRGEATTVATLEQSAGKLNLLVAWASLLVSSNCVASRGQGTAPHALSR